MKGQNNPHLQEGRILWAVIDDEELAADEQQHLQNCPACTSKVEQFQAELQELGHKARMSVPPLSRPVSMPKARVAAVSHSTGWLPFFAAAAMAGFVVFFYFMAMENTAPPVLTPLQVQNNLLEDETLMREISELVEDPLSDDMYEISGEDGIGFDDDEDEFLQFILPDIENDLQS